MELAFVDWGVGSRPEIAWWLWSGKKVLYRKLRCLHSEQHAVTAALDTNAPHFGPEGVDSGWGSV